MRKIILVIYKAMVYKNGIYTMPLDVKGYIYSTNKEYDEDLPSGLISDSIPNGEKSVLENKEANFKSQKFEDLLVYVKSLVDNNTIPLKEDENIYSYYLNYDSIWSQQLMMPYFGEISEYNDEVLAQNINGKPYFTAPHSLSINSKSENIDIAWDFIKFALSEEVQSSPLIFPINKKALENGFKNNIEFILNDAEESGLELTDKSNVISEEYVNKLSYYCKSLSEYVFKDAVINSIIGDEVMIYFSGEQNIDMTISNIQSKTEIYLHE
ncbi:MAG: hypothetical protein ACK5LT_06130 [Lachnospirales bacterium]